MDGNQPLFMANRILDNVFVGSHYAAEDEDFIFTNSISRVINTVSHQVSNRFQTINVRYLSYQFDYNGSSVILDARDERITQIVRFVNEAIEQDACVLIHSQNGDSRSVVVMAAYLIHRFHWPPHRALQFIATKRQNARPNTNYVKQLHEFANRRRAKYGEFKDIFGSQAAVRSLKLNFQEILHRNTYLNATMQQEDVQIGYTQKTPRQALVECGIIQNTKKPSNVTFRDGGQTNGVSQAQQQQLHRPRTPSYSSLTEIRCVPIRLDEALVPAVSFDLDIPGIHQRREDGYLKTNQQALQRYAVAAKPVSILKVHLDKDRQKYDPSAIVVPVEQFEDILRQSGKRPAQPAASQVEQVPQMSNTLSRPGSAARPVQTAPISSVQNTQPISQTQVGNLSIGRPSYGSTYSAGKPQPRSVPQPSAQLNNRSPFTVRPPTPPRSKLGQPELSTNSQVMRQVNQQQQYSSVPGRGSNFGVLGSSLTAQRNGLMQPKWK